jgi:hypothetical protein
MDNDGEGCQSLCAELTKLCRNDMWRQNAKPAGTQLHATKFIDILHLDFLYIGLSRDGKYQYIILLKDDLSGYLWIALCRTADVATTFDAPMRWFSVFGVMMLWISDRGNHFKNEVVRRL